MFFIREIQYLYYYEKSKKCCSAGTCKCQVRDEKIVLDVCLKKLPLFYPMRMNMYFTSGIGNQLIQQECNLSQGQWDYRFAFSYPLENIDCDKLYFLFQISSDKVICDEKTLFEYVTRGDIWGRGERFQDTQQKNMAEETFGGSRREKIADVKPQKRQQENWKRNEYQELEQESGKGNEYQELEQESGKGNEHQELGQESGKGNEYQELEQENGKRNRYQELTQEGQKTNGFQNPQQEMHEEDKEAEIYAASGQSLVHIPNRYGQKDQYYVTLPKQLKKFGKAFQQYEDNSFLLHGYYNYRHILVGPASETSQGTMCIGVPGNYYKREEVVAKMFGFLNFVPAKGEQKTGVFGYYYTSMLPVEMWESKKNFENLDR